jgi:regulator of ribonuclease activity A
VRDNGYGPPPVTRASGRGARRGSDDNTERIDSLHRWNHLLVVAECSGHCAGTAANVQASDYPCSRMSTSDVFDANGSAQVCELQLRTFGGVAAFEGEVSTVRCFEDNVVLRRRLSEPGEGRVLVVDGAGSMRCALVGDNIASLAIENGWNGLVVHGCVRDVEELARLPLGIKALGTCPRPSDKTGAGEVDVPVSFGGATFAPGARLWSDADGIVLV